MTSSEDKFLSALENLRDEALLSEETDISVIDAIIRAAGGDPAELGQRFATVARQRGQTNRKAAWRAQGERKKSVIEGAIGTVRDVGAMGRNQMLALLNELRRDERLQLSAAFRKRVPETSSDSELRELLTESLRVVAIRDALELESDDDDTSTKE